MPRLGRTGGIGTLSVDGLEGGAVKVGDDGSPEEALVRGSKDEEEHPVDHYDTQVLDLLYCTGFGSF